MIITNLLTNMVVLGLSGQIPTNTPAFQVYARVAMFVNAQDASSRWGLDQGLIATNRITRFSAVPYPKGYSASIEFSGRYEFGIEEGDWHDFTDEAYCERTVFVYTNGDWEIKYGSGRKDKDPEQHSAEFRRLWIAALAGDEKRNQAKAERWGAATNLLTLRKARRIAQSAARLIGVPTEWAGFKRQVKGQQTVWEEPSAHVFLPPEAVARRHGPRVAITGLPENAGDVMSVVGPLSDGGWSVTYARKHPKKLALPYYEFRWEGPDGFPVCEVEVSGITGKIAHFEYYGPGAEMGTPTNYFQLLGLPANVVFVRLRTAEPRTYETVP